jgi:hypothetical protein
VGGLKEMATVDYFEINSYNEVMIRSYKNGRSTETTWHSVPLKVIRWFVNLKSAPTLAEVEAKITAANNAEDRKHSDTLAGIGSFWKEDD